jgi:hypothetical protein
MFILLAYTWDRRVHLYILANLQQGEKLATPILWNMWVLLAMPAVWLAWLVVQHYPWFVDQQRSIRSIIFFVVCVMVFVWHTGTTTDSSISPLSPDAALRPRIVISVVLSLGILCFILILNTFAHWGYTMDKEWTQRWRYERQHYISPSTRSSAHSPHSVLSSPPVAPLPDSGATTIDQVQN